jgi:hypothetical protein
LKADGSLLAASWMKDKNYLEIDLPKDWNNIFFKPPPIKRQSAKMERAKNAQKLEAEKWENTGRNTMRISRKMWSSYLMQAQNR